MGKKEKDSSKGKNSKKSSSKKSDRVVPADTPPPQAAGIPQPQDEDVSNVTAALHLDHPGHSYTEFVDDVRQAWAEHKHDNIYVLPEANKSRRHAHIYIYADGLDEKLKIFTERFSGYIKAFSIVRKKTEEEEEKEYCCWFNDHAPNKNCKLICNSNYGGMKKMANYKDLKKVRIGKDALSDAYDGLREYLIGMWDKNIEVTKVMKRRAGRSILTIVLMVSEAARFDDVKTIIHENYYRDIELEGGIPGIDNQVKNWSNISKSQDINIRLFQYANWKNIPIHSRDNLIYGSTLDGYRVHFVGPDGNCQFRALAHQLTENDGEFAQVREQVVDQLYADLEANGPPLGYTEKEYRAYLVEMSMDGVWGDQLTLQAAADAYNSSIVVEAWSENQRRWIRHEIEPRGHDVLPVREIYLGLRNEHYSSLFPREILPPIVDSEDEEHDND
ncbi:hypothetical protein CASFOL_039109 [Castilleja foliolosa]|uniref:OTU domain-containing protein n=1 Tax=Castilleja foliolosa TaxID=1961234 RepID=A0ABD3BH31_9LAMI